MRPQFALLFALCALLFAAPAGAAETGQPNAVQLREVERGFWVGSSFGGVFFPSLPGDDDHAGSGALVGIEVGYDLLRDLQISALIWGTAIGADADYKGINDIELDPKGARGDFQSLMAGASLRWAPIRFADDNHVDRTFLFLRVAGGASMSRPEGVVGDGLWAAVGPGVEYFTRLRHFSIGLEVDGMMMKTDEGQALGVAVLPNLKYSF